MTRKRKAITLATKVAVLQSQAICGCGCGEKLGDSVIYDHVLAHALEGSDGPENIRAIRVDCDKIVTNGTKATTAGSTKHTVAKVKRIRKKRGGASDGTPVEPNPKPRPPEPAEAEIEYAAPKRTIQNRGFQKPPPGHKHFPTGRKIQSRKGAGA